MSQRPQYNQYRERQTSVSSRGHVYQETGQELGISGQTGTIPR